MKTKYLFFDTETTGLPNNWKAPASDLNNWPRMIQIGWILCDQDGNKINVKDYIIKPENFTIPTETSNIHGITTELAEKQGHDLRVVLEELNELIEQADCIVAHNINFDTKVLEAEFIRKNITTQLNKKNKICTMEMSTDYCAIPGYYGYKFPKLSELHIKLFGHDFEKAHNAAADISATEKCFWELKRLGIMNSRSYVI